MYLLAVLMSLFLKDERLQGTYINKVSLISNKYTSEGKPNIINYYKLF